MQEGVYVMYKVLVVEDDMVIAKTLTAHLEKWEYETTNITDFKEVMSTFAQFEPHIVLMDISLPFYNGYHWCTQIREVSKVPVIFLSSMSDNMNIVMAINMGGDDFITKPYDLNVVTAKVQALLRRTYSFGSEPVNIIEHNGGILNICDTTFSYNNQNVELTKNEFKILQQLLEHAGRVVSRDSIMEHLWENESFIDDNTLTVNVTRLRKKLEDIGLTDYITTKKGIGYIIL